MSCAASTKHVHDSCSSVPPPTVPSPTMRSPAATGRPVVDEAAARRRPHALSPATTDAKATAEEEQGVGGSGRGHLAFQATTRTLPPTHLTTSHAARADSTRAYFHRHAMASAAAGEEEGRGGSRGPMAS
jgi:hypothetical protein